MRKLRKSLQKIGFKMRKNSSNQHYKMTIDWENKNGILKACYLARYRTFWLCFDQIEQLFFNNLFHEIIHFETYILSVLGLAEDHNWCHRSQKAFSSRFHSSSASCFLAKWRMKIPSQCRSFISANKRHPLLSHLWLDRLYTWKKVIFCARLMFLFRRVNKRHLCFFSNIYSYLKLRRTFTSRRV